MPGCNGRNHLCGHCRDALSQRGGAAARSSASAAAASDMWSWWLHARSSGSADALQHVHIGASAKAATSTRDNDHADIGVVSSTVQRVEVGAAHWSGPGVQPVRPIERDYGYAIGGFVENYIVGGHGFP